MKIKMIMSSIILALGLTACGLDLGDEVSTYTNSLNTTTITDSYNENQEQILEDGYTPDEPGVCESGFFWCSIEQKCLPTIDGATCPLAHTDSEEAEAQEISDNS